MKIGVFASFLSPFCTPDVIAAFGSKAEAIGLDSIWMGEHVVLFDETEHPYPYGNDGRLPIPRGSGMLDPIGTFGLLAAVTDRIRLGTGISLIPQRNPLYTAKEIATLDWLSRGRVDFGVGAGWCKEEVLACGYGWEDRGDRCDEFLRAMIELWTKELAVYEGEHISLPACRMDPKPVQKPHVPILVGGHSRRALRRTAELGAGWFGFNITPAETAEILTRLDEVLAANGRSRADCEILVMPASETADDLAAFRSLGVDRLLLMLGAQRPDRIEQRLGELEALARAGA